MNDEPNNPPDAGVPEPPLDYQAPGTPGGSQWITDSQPGGKWLVAGLIVLSGVGVVAGAVVWVAWLFVGC